MERLCIQGDVNLPRTPEYPIIIEEDQTERLCIQGDVNLPRMPEYPIIIEEDNMERLCVQDDVNLPKMPEYPKIIEEHQTERLCIQDDINIPKASEFSIIIEEDHKSELPNPSAIPTPKIFTFENVKTMTKKDYELVEFEMFSLTFQILTNLEYLKDLLKEYKPKNAIISECILALTDKNIVSEQRKEHLQTLLNQLKMNEVINKHNQRVEIVHFISKFLQKMCSIYSNANKNDLINSNQNIYEQLFAVIFKFRLAGSGDKTNTIVEYGDKQIMRINNECLYFKESELNGYVEKDIIYSNITYTFAIENYPIYLMFNSMKDIIFLFDSFLAEKSFKTVKFDNTTYKFIGFVWLKADSNFCVYLDLINHVMSCKDEKVYYDGDLSKLYKHDLLKETNDVFVILEKCLE